MAELRANTMQSSINPNLTQLKWLPVVVIAKKKPIMANGSANMVCAKSTSEKYFFILGIKLRIKFRYYKTLVYLGNKAQNLIMTGMQFGRCNKIRRNGIKSGQQRLFKLGHVLVGF